MVGGVLRRLLVCVCLPLVAPISQDPDPYQTPSYHPNRCYGKPLIGPLHWFPAAAESESGSGACADAHAR